MRRRVFACPDVGIFTTLADWPGLRAVLAIETIRGVPGRGKVTAEIRHYLSSAALPPERLAAAIRDHWRVENGLHWVLDVTFREDDSRVRDRSAALNLALLRRIALNLVARDRGSRTQRTLHGFQQRQRHRDTRTAQEGPTIQKILTVHWSRCPT